MARAIQKIKLVIVSFVNALLNGKPTQYKLAMQTPVVVTYDKFVQNIVNETGLSKTQCNAVLGAVSQCAGDYMALGNAVQIHPDLGTLKPKITVNAVSSEKEAVVKTISGIGIRFIPTGEMRSLLADTQFQIVGKGSAENAESDLVDPNDPANENEDVNPGNEPEDVTLTFKHHDNTEDTRTGKPGTALSAPAADSGYMWSPSVPSTFPSTPQTYTEVADDQQIDPDSGL